MLRAEAFGGGRRRISYRQLENTTVSTWFNGGVRINRAIEGPKGVTDAPPHVEEIGFYIPEAPPKNPSGTIQINHATISNLRDLRALRGWIGKFVIVIA